MSFSRNIKLLIAFDGSDFNGWQIQDKGRTVQAVLESALAEMHKHEVRITGAGRTDSGVHARGQVANFSSDLGSVPAEKYCDALNSILPKDVRILESSETDPNFHSRYDALKRTYRYYILPGKQPLPWQRKYCLPIRRRPNIRTLSAVADCFTGRHDFTAFSAAGGENTTSERVIFSSSVFISGEYLVYQITGNAFLWRMVRSIVGTMLELEAAGKGPKEASAILASRKRERAGTTAAPQGLFLHHIEYGDAHG